MGIVQKESISTTITSYLGLVVGYINKGVLFVVFLTAEEVGLLNLLVSVGVLFGHLSNLGLINTTWKFFPFFRNEKMENYDFLKSVLKIILISSVIFSLIFLIFKKQITYFYEDKSELFVANFFWIIPIGIGTVFYLVSDIYLRGLFKNTLSVVANELIHRLFISALLLVYCLDAMSFEWLIVLFALSYFVPALILLIYLVNLGELSFKKSKYKIPVKFRKILINYSLFNYFNSIGTMAVLTIDAMMIASFMGLKETGVYTTVLYLISAMQVPNRSIVRVGSGLVVQYWKERNMVKMQALYKKTSSISLIIALYTFVLVWVNLDIIFSILPKAYGSGTMVFLLLMAGKLVDIFFGLNGTIFITSKKYRLDIFLTVFLLISVYVLNLYLLPTLGLIGAAISTSVAILSYNIARLIMVWIWYKMHPFEWNQLVVILIGALIVLGYYWVPNNYVPNKFVVFGINSVVITAVYFGIILKLKLNEELNNYFQKIQVKFLGKKTD